MPDGLLQLVKRESLKHSHDRYKCQYDRTSGTSDVEINEDETAS